MPTLSRNQLARFFDHTLVQPEATRADLERLCAEAVALGCHGVCVNGSRVELAYARLEETEVKVTGLVGFPFGAGDADAKRYEAEVAIDQGAHELEVVFNVGWLKDGDRARVLRELRDVAEAADERPVKVILETTLLTVVEIGLACDLIVDSGAQGVCAGTGLRGAATVDTVRQLRASVGPKLGVKAAGVADASTALALIEAGATRLGATATAAILAELAAG